jgi:colanic acid biosynthesis glycosyl transferase WcaI
VNILYVSQYFPPEMGAPSARAVELARHWVRTGHKVMVLTGFPNHPTGVVPPEWRSRWRRLVYRETVDGIEVVRTWLLPLPNRKAYERMLNYGSFCVSAALRGMGMNRSDVVIATSPQLLVGLSGAWIAHWKRMPFVLEVRDLWPESLIAVGVSNENSFLHRSLSALAGFLYRDARHIVVVTPAFREFLIQRWKVPASKISVVENGVETELFSPESGGAEVKRQFGLEGKFVVGYIGTMGVAHGLDTLIDAAASLLATRPNIAFLLVGEGADRERIQSIAHRRGLTNLLFVDQQARERVPAFIAASDACVVLLKKTELFKTVIPTKMLEFMACARPVILGVEGQARAILEEARAGIAIAPENDGALVEAIVGLERDASMRTSMGTNARHYIVERYSRERTARDYIAVLTGVADPDEAEERPAAL